MIIDRWKKLQSYIATRIRLGGALPNDGYLTMVPKLLGTFVGSNANVGAGETTILTFPFPAGSLKVAGDFFEYVMEFDMVSAGVTKTIKYKFGGQEFNANAWNNTIASTQGVQIGRCYRVTSTTCRCYIANSLPFVGQTTCFTQFGDITVSNMDTNSLDFVVTLQGTNNADITHRVSHLYLNRQ